MNMSTVQVATAPTASKSKSRMLRALTLGKKDAGGKQRGYKKTSQVARDEMGIREPVPQIKGPVPLTMNPSVQGKAGCDEIQSVSPVQEKINVAALVHVDDIQLPSTEPQSTTDTADSPPSTSPTLLTRITTRIRKLSRPSKVDATSNGEEQRPPVPSVPSVLSKSDPRPTGLLQRAATKSTSKGSRASLFFNFSKSTPSLVPNEPAAPIPDVPLGAVDHARIAKRSSMPMLSLSIPSLPSFTQGPVESSIPEGPRPDADTAKAVRPVSSLLPAFSYGSRGSASAVSKSSSKRFSAEEDPTRIVLFPANPSTPSPSPLPTPPLSGLGIPRSTSKFFVGDDNDSDGEDEEEGPRIMGRSDAINPSSSPPSSYHEVDKAGSPGVTRTRGASASTPRDSPPQARPRSATTGAGGRKARPLSVFAGWRRSSYVEPFPPEGSYSPSRSIGRSRHASVDTTSSSSSKRVAVSPTMHTTGGFTQRTERIVDPESRRLTENAFM